MKEIQVAGCYDCESYSLIISFSSNHAITLDGLSEEDMLELQSCINLMLRKDDE